MIFQRIHEPGLSQTAYLVGCEKAGEALVVDPLHDIDQYLDAAHDQGLRIVAVAETHIHADFLSGARALARACRATLLVSGETDDKWAYRNLVPTEGVDDHRLLHHGDTVEIGESVRIDVLHTPGHTIEHLAYLVTDTARTDAPMLLLSGDFVFVGDLGRPDLTRGLGDAHDARWYARQLFDSLAERFLELPGHVVLWPAHGSGSACGKALGQVPSSSVGFERRAGWWDELVENGDFESFRERLLEGQPEPPRYFSRMKRLNRDGPGTHGDLTLPARLTPREVSECLRAGNLLLDLRDVRAFAREHVRGSLNLSSLAHLSTHAGSVVDPGEGLLLLVPDEELEQAVRALMRVGLGPVTGYVPSLDPFTPSDARTSFEVITAEEAHRLWKQPDVTVLDVRARKEFETGHIPDALHIQYGELPSRLDEVPRDQTLVVHCASGVRASVACSVLERAGFESIKNFAGGPSAWKACGYPLETDS